jgi:hypothetical protein
MEPASSLTSPAVLRALLVTPVTRAIASAPVHASPEARLTPSAMEGTAEFCWSTVAATMVAMDDILFGGFGGLPGQRFHLGRRHSETLAGFTGARGLDGGVERQQIGLLCDRLD